MAKASLEDRQAEIGALTTKLVEIGENLENAETCETERAFRANIKDALAGLAELTSELQELT